MSQFCRRAPAATHNLPELEDLKNFNSGQRMTTFFSQTNQWRGRLQTIIHESSSCLRTPKKLNSSFLIGFPEPVCFEVVFD